MLGHAHPGRVHRRPRSSLRAGIVAVGRRRAVPAEHGRTLDERQVPLAGLVAAFVFAVQMLNFPVASGTSGHLLGGVLAAVLVGPGPARCAVTVVLVVQALLFADGGLSALGLNVVNMALVGAFGGYAVFVVLRAACSARATTASRSRAGVAAAFVASSWRPSPSRRVRHRRQRAASVGTVAGGDGRRPRADRHRRGRHHRADGRRRCWRSRPDLVYGARDLAVPRARRPGRPGGGADMATATASSLFAFVVVGLVVAAGCSRSS